jgi:hypothetical protein
MVPTLWDPLNKASSQIMPSYLPHIQNDKESHLIIRVVKINTVTGFRKSISVMLWYSMAASPMHIYCVYSTVWESLVKPS